MSDTSSPSLFQSLAALSEPRYPFQIASPEDILPPDPEDLDGRYQIREGAATTTLMLRPLSPAELEEADKILAGAGAPPPIMKKNADGSQMLAGYDEDAPEYRAKLEPLLRKRQVFMVLKGCPALYDSATGGDMSAKIDSVMQSVPDAILRLLSQRIFTFSFPAGDMADFFTKGKSEPTPG